MTDLVMVVRCGERYVASRIHHRAFTFRLAEAQTYLTREAAQAAADKAGGEAVLVELKETE